MRKSAKEIAEEQLLRYAKFPKDRIAFRSELNVAQDDQREFRRYINNEITLLQLCELIRQNNHLPRITEYQMMNELIITGWIIK